MEIKGKLLQLLPLQSGEGKNGTWKKQDIIIETLTTYPKKVCISVWGDKIKPEILNVGNILVIQFDVESREYNSRWYSEIRAWKIELDNESSENNYFNNNSNQEEAGDDGLPF